MNTKEAKDFLVEQVSAQATLEGISLSDLEKRMMYFTESDHASCESPIELNDEFEAEYDTPQYETKMSGLLRHSYDRLTKESSQLRGNWDEAMRVLQKGDHYMLVLWRASPSSDHPSRDFVKHVGIGVLIGVVIAVVILIRVLFGGSR